MAKQVQFRRGTTAEHSTFVGAVGEVTVDITKDVVVVHDGITIGGWPAAQANDVTAANTAISALQATVGLLRIDLNTLDPAGASGEQAKLRANIAAANVSIANLNANATVQATAINLINQNLLGANAFTDAQRQRLDSAELNISTTQNDVIAANTVVAILAAATTANAIAQSVAIDSLRGNVTAANLAIVTANSAVVSYVNDLVASELANAASQATAINSLRANITASNVNISTLQTQVYANSNVATYLAHVTTDIVPNANVTYSLGTSTKRFKDLWLSGSTIYIGNTTISTNTDGSITIPSLKTEAYGVAAIGPGISQYTASTPGGDDERYLVEQNYWKNHLSEFGPYTLQPSVIGNGDESFDGTPGLIKPEFDVKLDGSGFITDVVITNPGNFPDGQSFVYIQDGHFIRPDDNEPVYLDAYIDPAHPPYVFGPGTSYVGTILGQGFTFTYNNEDDTTPIRLVGITTTYGAFETWQQTYGYLRASGYDLLQDDYRVITSGGIYLTIVPTVPTRTGYFVEVRELTAKDGISANTVVASNVSTSGTTATTTLQVVETATTKNLDVTANTTTVTLDVSGDATISGNLTIDGNLTVSPDSIHMGNLTLSSTGGNLVSTGNVIGGSYYFANGVNILTSVETNINTLNSDITAANAAILVNTNRVAAANVAIQSAYDRIDLGNLKLTAANLNISILNSNVTAANSAISTNTNRVAAANAAIIAANNAVVSYVNSLNNAVTASVNAANAAIVTANNAVVSYLNSQNADLLANITAANAAIVASTNASVSYSNSLNVTMTANITAANAAIVTANSAVVSYTNSLNSAMVANVTAANASVTAANAAIVTANSAVVSYVSSLNSAVVANVTAANVEITALRANVTAANTNIASFNYIKANIQTNGNVVASNVNVAGNIIVSGLYPAIRLVRTPDTDVTSNEIYGAVEFIGEDVSTAASGARAKIFARAHDSIGGTSVDIYTVPEGGYTQTMNRQFTANANGAYVAGGLFVGAKDSNGSGATGRVSYGQYGYPLIGTGVAVTGSYTSASRGALYSGIGNTGSEIIINGDLKQTGSTQLTANLCLSDYIDVLGASLFDTSGGCQVDLDIWINGQYAPDSANNSTNVSRLRKRWVASCTYFTGNLQYVIMDQQLTDAAVFNTDAVNFAAGAANAGKVYLQANATAGTTSLQLRFDNRTSPAVASATNWTYKIVARRQVVN